MRTKQAQNRISLTKTVQRCARHVEALFVAVHLLVDLPELPLNWVVDPLVV